MAAPMPGCNSATLRKFLYRLETAQPRLKQYRDLSPKRTGPPRPGDLTLRAA